MRNEAQEREAALSMISGAVKTLAYYSEAARDGNLLEEILNTIFKRRFEELNRPREEPKYAKKANEGSVGSVWLGRANNPDPHCMDISFCPSPQLQEKTRYLQSVIGVIDLARKTYGLASRNSYEPAEIFSHAEKIMRDWGLKKTKFKRTPQD